jgi:hypothetical protein
LSTPQHRQPGARVCWPPSAAAAEHGGRNGAPLVPGRAARGSRGLQRRPGGGAGRGAAQVGAADGVLGLRRSVRGEPGSAGLWRSRPRREAQRPVAHAAGDKRSGGRSLAWAAWRRAVAASGAVVWRACGRAGPTRVRLVRLPRARLRRCEQSPEEINDILQVRAGPHARRSRPCPACAALGACVLANTVAWFAVAAALTGHDVCPPCTRRSSRHGRAGRGGGALHRPLWPRRPGYDGRQRADRRRDQLRAGAPVVAP